MSLSSYDKAMDTYLKGIYPNVMMLHSAEGLAAYSAETLNNLPLESDSDAEKKLDTDEWEDANMVALPLITFYRMSNPLNLEEMGQYAMTNRGAFYPDQGRLIKEFPIKINYQIDIWSDRRVQVDDIWRELIQYIHENKYITVKFDGLDVPENYHMNLIGTDTTTDVSSFDAMGRLHRETLDIEIPQATMKFEEAVNLVEKIPVHYVSFNDLEQEEGEHFEVSGNEHI